MITDLIEEDGEYNAVRIMNLHKAKGLEGNVILLADPSTGVSGFNDTMLFIEDDGIKKGFIIPTVGKTHIGKPDGWNDAKAISDALKREEHLTGYFMWPPPGPKKRSLLHPGIASIAGGKLQGIRPGKTWNP